MDPIKEMADRIAVLNRAAKAYYAEGAEIMSNFAYDRIYDELLALEEKSGIVLAGSPTQKVGYEVASELPKERHPSRMLSLNKTKDSAELAAWLGEQKGLLSWKLDGITIVLTYRDGNLYKAVTRGNGDVGEVITENARQFVNLPVKIAYKGELILRGEAVITYADFEEVNAGIASADRRYKNPRNLCAGSVRQLDPRITAERHVRLYAFTLVSAADVDFENSHLKQMEWLRVQGFATVENIVVTQETLPQEIHEFEDRIRDYELPSDGLVLLYDDIAYGDALGQTAKFPRNAIAFKWQDETAETVLRAVDWSASRTGLINPIAVFDPVELEGTTVSRASVHNVSVARELHLGIGDHITVYKANMIIPQIAENLTKSDRLPLPAACPVCGKPVTLRSDNGVETLYCSNPDCLAKQIKRLAHLVSRDALNIDGLSEMTLERLVDEGIIRTPADLFHLTAHREAIAAMDRFGEKSFENLCAAAEKARTVTPAALLYGLGIPGVGKSVAKAIADFCRNNWEKMCALTEEELQEIDGIGTVIAHDYVQFFADPARAAETDALAAELAIDETYREKEAHLAGLTFVITGSLTRFTNREEMKAALEAAGARVAGSVSKNTSFLINNDLTSTSGKNKKAKELGIPVINEEEAVRMIRSED